jgi:CRISPR-associated endoribonuclease Cas6
MRLIVKFIPLENFAFDEVCKHTLQGFIYSALKGSDFDGLHDAPKFKFFCFSDIFPSTEFIEGEIKNIIISSPDSGFITSLYKSLREKKGELRLNTYKIKIVEMKKFYINLKNRFISGSPIVLYKDNRRNIYYSFRRDGDTEFFLTRLKENALKKYNVYFNDDFVLEGEIFDNFEFKKEVAVRNFKGGREFIVIGNVWNLLEKYKINKDERKFYNFIMDCGLGEKNSMGFGFINPLK